MLKNPAVKYIPCLHSNTSRLEAHFSFVRGRGLDTLSNFGRSITISTHRKTLINLKPSSNYNYGDEIGKDESSKTYKSQESSFDYNLLMKTWKSFEVNQDDRNIPKQNFEYINEFELHIRKSIRKGTYFDALLSNKIFEEWISLAAYLYGQRPKSTMSIFMQIQNSNEIRKEYLLDLIIKLSYEVLKVLDMALSEGKQNLPYEIGISRICNKNVELIKKFWIDFGGSESDIQWQEISILIQSIANHIQNLFLSFKYPKQDSMSHFKTVQNDEIVRFLGYAIYQTRLAWSKRTDDASEYEHGVKLLDSFRFFHAEALQDEDYCSEVYIQNNALMLNNNSYLTLPRMELVPFGKELMKILNTHTSEEEMLRRGNQTYSSALQHLSTNQKLRKLFGTALFIIYGGEQNGRDSLDEVEEKILTELLTRSLNARMNATITKYNDTKHESKNVKTRSEIKAKVKNQATEAKQRQLNTNHEPVN